jgi:hypothetical protein
MAKHSTTAWASFPTRGEADQAVQRLSSGGFARNSIDLDRQQDGTWNVVVHTSERNLQHVERLLRSSSPMYAAYSSLPDPMQLLKRNGTIAFGAAALAGLTLYALLHGERRSTMHGIRRFPRRVWDAAQALPERLSETAQTMQESVAELTGTLRETVGSLTNRDAEHPSGGEAGTKPR